MSSPKRTIAVIGTGLIGPRHAAAIQQAPESELFCLVDLNPAAKDLAKQFNVPYHASIQSMLKAQGKPDGAIVCTPNSSHVVVSKELLDAGIHVITEKPISVTAEEGRSLVEHAKSKNLSLLVGHHRRFNRYVATTKDIIASKQLGRIIAVTGLWCTFKPNDYFQPPTAWRQSGKTGGPILINLIHEIDVLQFLFGPIIRVHAEQTMKQRKFDAEEGAALIFKFESGIVGTFLLSDAVPSPHNFEAGTGENPLMPYVGKDTYRIMGSEGTLSVPDMQLWAYKGTKSWLENLNEGSIDVPEMKVPFERQVAHFVKVIKSEEKPICSGAEGVSAVAVCEAVKEALATGMPVDVVR